MSIGCCCWLGACGWGPIVGVDIDPVGWASSCAYGSGVRYTAETQGFVLTHHPQVSARSWLRSNSQTARSIKSLMETPVRSNRVSRAPSLGDRTAVNEQDGV